MGSEATRDLAQTSDFEEIVIADLDLQRGEALASELGGGRIRAIVANADDEVALTEKLRGFDVVANCTTYHFGLNVIRAAIAAQVNYLRRHSCDEVQGFLFSRPLAPEECTDLLASQSAAQRAKSA